MNFARVVFKVANLIPRFFNKFFVSPLKKASFCICGKDVTIGSHASFSGIENMVVGNHVAIGARNCFMTTRAKIVIKDYVMFGPDVTVITGNHRIDIMGRYMFDVKDEDKRTEDDVDVVFEGDNWIGANCIILKGVTVGFGSVIGAGSVVSRDVEPYSIVGGVPAKKIKNRFSDLSSLDNLLSEDMGEK